MVQQRRAPKRTGPILVIDDEPTVLRMLTYVFGREGYPVETADNGEEGLARWRDLHPSLVFLDVMMPRINGIEVCRRIREDATLADTYVIMLSAKGQQADREEALLNGADEYLIKPFSPREVVQHVRELLETGELALANRR